MSKELLVAVLDNEFYNKYKPRLDEAIFMDSTAKDLFRTIQKYYNEHNENLSIEALKALYYASNPVISNSYRKTCEVLFEELQKVELSKGVQEDILKKAIACHKWAEIASLAIEGSENKAVDKSKILQLLDDAESGGNATVREYVTNDIKALLNERKKNFKWKVHCTTIGNAIGGVGPGVFVLVAARPNAGKTAFVCSLMYHPEGFCSQGAKVHLIGNEEPADRTKLRGICCYTGLLESDLEQESNVVYATNKFSSILDNQYVLDEVGMSLTEVEEYVKLHKDNLDILIIDQLDKVRIDGDFKREDLRIRALYTNTREIAKRYGICIIGVCQASAEAEGKLYWGANCLEHSKTGKYAEVDLLIGIGKGSIDTTGAGDDGARVANIIKNKLTGNEVPVHYILNAKLSRIQE